MFNSKFLLLVILKYDLPMKGLNMTLNRFGVSPLFFKYQFKNEI